MMKTIIETLWQSLETGAVPASGIVIRRFPPDFLPEISAALRLPEKYPALSIRLPESTLHERLTDQNFRDLNVSIPASDPTILLIELRNPALREIFAVLCDDFANHLKFENMPAVMAGELRSRLHQWSLLFEKSASPGLSPEEQRGLFGELAVLKMLLERSSYSLPVLNGWLGPSGGVQDFFYTDLAIEVKTTLGNNHQFVLVSNALQLDESLLTELWLAHFSLEISESGTAETLNEAIMKLLFLLENETEAVTRFRVKLAEAGYFDKHTDQYKYPAYHIRNKCFYEIKGAFPRIRSAELRTGIEALKYRIRVDDCQPWLVDFSAIIEKIQSLRHDPYH